MIRRNRLDAELQRREMELMRREMELLRRENNLLRASSRSVSATSQATVNIKSIGELLSEYQGSGEDFEQWKTQINLLRTTYELDENAVKILIGSKLGQGASMVSLTGRVFGNERGGALERDASDV